MLQAIQSDASLQVVNKQPMQSCAWLRPRIYGGIGQALEHFWLYLDQIKQELDAQDKNQKPK